MPLFRTQKCGAQGDEVDHLVDFFYNYRTGLREIFMTSFLDSTPVVCPEKVSDDSFQIRKFKCVLRHC